MRALNWKIKLGVSLVALSALLYGLHYLIFRDSHHIYIYLLGDIAFIPIDVFLVTLIIHQLMSAHEKRSMMKKMNMVIGTFYSEVGTPLLGMAADFDSTLRTIKPRLVPAKEWRDPEFIAAQAALKSYKPAIDSRKGALGSLRSFLIGKRQFLLSLLNNPILLEHESFTDLLWAVFHLSEELAERMDVSALPEKDYEHLSGDIKRVYNLLIHEWISYMLHLKNAYPYLFSLAIRTNPFDDNAAVEINQ